MLFGFLSFFFELWIYAFQSRNEGMPHEHLWVKVWLLPKQQWNHWKYWHPMFLVLLPKCLLCCNVSTRGVNSSTHETSSIICVPVSTAVRLHGRGPVDVSLWIQTGQSLGLWLRERKIHRTNSHRCVRIHRGEVLNYVNFVLYFPQTHSCVHFKLVFLVILWERYSWLNSGDSANHHSSF